MAQDRYLAMADQVIIKGMNGSLDGVVRYLNLRHTMAIQFRNILAAGADGATDRAAQWAKDFLDKVAPSLDSNVTAADIKAIIDGTPA